MTTAVRRKLTDDEIKTIIGQEIAAADGYGGDELASNREQALDYYYGKKPGATLEGRSSAVSTDVSDMIEAIISDMMPAFDLDDIVVFEPESREDVTPSAEETRAVNHVIMEQNRGYVVLQEAIRDALLLKNGFIKVSVDERIEAETQTFTDLDFDQAQLVKTPSDPEVETQIKSEELNDQGLVDLTVKITRTRRSLIVKSIDPTLLLWAQGHDSVFVDDIRFIAELQYLPRSELLAMGFDQKVVDDLAPHTQNVKTDNQHRWFNFWRADQRAQEPSQDLIELYECYILLDADGDGTSELHRIMFADETVLADDLVELRPYLTGTPFLQPHRFIGRSVFDRLQSVQDQKTFTLRQWSDNLNHGNNARVIADETLITDPDAMTNSIPAGIVWARDAQRAVMPFPTTDIGQSAAAMLEYQDKRRSEAGGASLDLQTAEAQIAGDTAHGVERMYSAREKQVEMMTRNLAETMIRSTFLLVHQTMRLFMPGQLTFRAGKDFQSTDPAQWPVRTRLKVRAGLSSGERSRQQQMLANTYQIQKELIDAGMDDVMVDLPGLFNTLRDSLRVMGVGTPEAYYLDPASEDSQAALKRKSEEAQAAAKSAETQQMIPWQLQANIEENKNKLDWQKHQDELQFDYVKLAAEQALDEAKLIKDIELSQTQGPDDGQDTGKAAAAESSA